MKPATRQRTIAAQFVSTFLAPAVLTGCREDAPDRATSEEHRAAVIRTDEPTTVLNGDISPTVPADGSPDHEAGR
jgi:hypothetical protein